MAAVKGALQRGAGGRALSANHSTAQATLPGVVQNKEQKRGTCSYSLTLLSSSHWDKLPCADEVCPSKLQAGNENLSIKCLEPG